MSQHFIVIQIRKAGKKWAKAIRYGKVQQE
jgi:hypothetical protein